MSEGTWTPIFYSEDRYFTFKLQTLPRCLGGTVGAVINNILIQFWIVFLIKVKWWLFMLLNINIHTTWQTINTFKNYPFPVNDTLQHGVTNSTKGFITFLPRALPSWLYNINRSELFTFKALHVFCLSVISVAR